MIIIIIMMTDDMMRAYARMPSNDNVFQSQQDRQRRQNHNGGKGGTKFRL